MHTNTLMPIKCVLLGKFNTTFRLIIKKNCQLTVKNTYYMGSKYTWFVYHLIVVNLVMYIWH